MNLSLSQKRIWAIGYFFAGILHFVLMLVQFSNLCEVPIGPYSVLYSVLVLGSDHMTSTGLVALISGLGLLLYDVFFVVLFVIAYRNVLKTGNVRAFFVLCVVDMLGALCIFLFLADYVPLEKWIGIFLSFVHALVFLIINREELMQKSEE